MPEVIDLDKIGAARREAQEERPVIRFNGKEFQLPPEMPFAVIEAIGRLTPAEEGGTVDNAKLAESIADIAHSLFGHRYREFLNLGPSVEDMSALLENIAPAYGLSADAAEEAKPAAAKLAEVKPTE